MKRLAVSFVISVFILLILTQNCDGIDINESAIVTWVFDGDSFNCIIKGEVEGVRLADVNATDDTNDPLYYNARNYLIGLIWNKTVLLDIDSKQVFDASGKRYVCVVYLDHNSTHYLNVNQDLVEKGHVNITDFDTNEFNPYEWTLFCLKPSPSPSPTTTSSPTQPPTPSISPTPQQPSPSPTPTTTPTDSPTPTPTDPTQTKTPTPVTTPTVEPISSPTSTPTQTPTPPVTPTPHSEVYQVLLPMGTVFGVTVVIVLACVLIIILLLKKRV